MNSSPISDASSVSAYFEKCFRDSIEKVLIALSIPEPFNALVGVLKFDLLNYKDIELHLKHSIKNACIKRIKMLRESHGDKFDENDFLNCKDLQTELRIAETIHQQLQYCVNCFKGLPEPAIMEGAERIKSSIADYGVIYDFHKTASECNDFIYYRSSRLTLIDMHTQIANALLVPETLRTKIISRYESIDRRLRGTGE